MPIVLIMLAFRPVKSHTVSGTVTDEKGNPLSSAMKILYFMAKEDELDKELVKFFYNSGLYLRYAKELLPESSIDEVTVDFSTL